MNKLPQELVLPVRLSDELRVICVADHSREACGLIIGTRRPDVVIASRIVQARNINHDRPHDRYTLDPSDFVAADRAARDVGLEIVGIWHSHSNSPAVPSATDLENAWPEYSYLIVAISSLGLVELRSWRLQNGRFEEETIRREECS